MVHGLKASEAVEVWVFPQEGADSLSALQASRAWRMAARERPGGDAFARGVGGTVSSTVQPKRHRRPSGADDSEELSSEALVLPMSGACSLSLPWMDGSVSSSEAASLIRFFLIASASALRSSAPCFALCIMASRASRLFTERTAAGVIGAPTGLIVSKGEEELTAEGTW